MSSTKYECPDFISDQDTYFRWLSRKAQTHFRRDRSRNNTTATIAIYKKAIHDAVCQSHGKDAYTNEILDWTLISTYCNTESKKHGRAYKSRFALLPTVDHVDGGTGPANFKICAWRTNDAKSDLTLDEFVELCRKVLEANVSSGIAKDKKTAPESIATEKLHKEFPETHVSVTTLCGCGCGERIATTNGTFKQGHDARLDSFCRKNIRGKASEDETNRVMQASVRSLLKQRECGHLLFYDHLACPCLITKSSAKK